MYLFKKELMKNYSVITSDSFQGVLEKPEEAFAASLIILSEIKKMNFQEVTRSSKPKPKVDLRLSIGVGTIDYLKKDIFK